MGTSKFQILVPLFDLKSLDRTRGLHARGFKSAALARVCKMGYQQRVGIADNIDISSFPVAE
jgi:hypothetical protein